MDASTIRPRRPTIAWTLALFLAAGCQKENDYVPPPPPEVEVQAPIARTITTYKEYTGTARGYETVELRARVKGFLQSMHFEPGAVVEEGQLLFVIDPKPFEAAVNVARADLASKKAQFAGADSEYRRTLQLYERNVTPELDLIKLKAARDSAQAAVEQAEAALEQADLDLGYTRVKAPIAGRISRNLVDVGNLVGDNEATLLASIVRYDPIRAYFTVSESDLFQFQELRRKGLRPDFRKQAIPMGLGLADEEGFPHEGTLEYADPAIDPETGTILARAVFPNEDALIFPGAFVRLRIPFELSRDVLLVPERALGSDQSGRYVLVVDDEGQVDQRPVELGSRVEDLVVIEKGVKPTDRVVVNGLQRARPGAKVKPVEPEGEKPPGNTEKQGPAEVAQRESG